MRVQILLLVVVARRQHQRLLMQVQTVKRTSAGRQSASTKSAEAIVVIDVDSRSDEATATAAIVVIVVDLAIPVPTASAVIVVVIVRSGIGGFAQVAEQCQTGHCKCGQKNPPHGIVLVLRLRECETDDRPPTRKWPNRPSARHNSQDFLVIRRSMPALRPNHDNYIGRSCGEFQLIRNSRSFSPFVPGVYRLWRRCDRSLATDGFARCVPWCGFARSARIFG